jgi:hypothetical protein
VGWAAARGGDGDGGALAVGTVVDVDDDEDKVQRLAGGRHSKNQGTDAFTSIAVSVGIGGGGIGTCAYASGLLSPCGGLALSLFVV